MLWDAESMPRIEREPPAPEAVAAKAREGWRLAAVVWERERPEPEPEWRVYDVVPFGLRVAPDCIHLIEDPQEREIILTALELIVQDYPLWRVAAEFNRRGFRTRENAAWTAASVFDLLPRLIDIGPRIFSSEEWAARRRRVFEAIRQ